MWFIKKLIEGGGRVSMVATGLLAMLIGLDTILRYGFSFTKNWILELETYLFSIGFLLAMAYALREDQHVRVDLFYGRLKEKSKRTIDVLGHLLLLIPWCLIILSTSYKYVKNSYSIFEQSPNPGGLPFRFLLKGLIFLCFLLLLIEAIFLIYRDLRIIFTDEKHQNV